ncbi:hypothetical protein FJT64_008146 [Amphibalanus amphitrite]|uniref:Uncharacterized protein n=1 Tax=Amphibalanus amphitrite TaxID=1232801 RepID=A0A6A4VI62_AMPAM|nr:hypothetical protein FJT64_008146 [Amphibalanus amphitrite]
MSAAGDAPAPSQKVGGAFGSPLTCADDLWRITKLWDESGSGVRAALLASFLGRFSSEPAVDLETALVGGASLLLARFVAALRLNGSHFSGGGVTGFSTPLSPLLAALRVFLRAQQCHRFAAEAVGGRRSGRASRHSETCQAACVARGRGAAHALSPARSGEEVQRGLCRR